MFGFTDLQLDRRPVGRRLDACEERLQPLERIRLQGLQERIHAGIEGEWTETATQHVRWNNCKTGGSARLIDYSRAPCDDSVPEPLPGAINAHTTTRLANPFNIPAPGNVLPGAARRP